MRIGIYIEMRMCAMTRPSWLNKKIRLKDCASVKTLLADLRLGTVCEEALCPNIGECFAKGQATFLILGKHCTRGCAFCGVKRKMPDPVDPAESARVAEAVERLGLDHVVITSVTRDDLPDGGAQAFVDTIAAVRAKRPAATIEVLIPDFAGNREALEKVVAAHPEILGHNIETVKRLYGEVRRGADYERSLEVLRHAAACDGTVRVKSGIMLGLGEREEEVLAALADVVETGCRFFSIGQYLAPGREHYPVQAFIPPDRFVFLKEKALTMGFDRVVSGPYVRSSYHAAEYLSPSGGEGR